MLKRVIALVVLSTFAVGVSPAPATTAAPTARPKTSEILLDTAAAQPSFLRVIRTQQDLGAIETFDDDTRNLMAFALATGTIAIVTTAHPIVSARYNWTGTPWLALGKTDEQFGTDQQGFHFNTGHENPNQADLDLSNDIVDIGIGLQGLGRTLMTQSPTPASKAIGAGIATLGLAITMFGLGMKLAISGRSGSVDPDIDDEDAGGPAGSNPSGPPGAPPSDPSPPSGAGQSIGLTGPDGTSVGGGGGGTPGDTGTPGDSGSTGDGGGDI